MSASFLRTLLSSHRATKRRQLFCKARRLFCKAAVVLQNSCYLTIPVLVLELFAIREDWGIA